MSSSPDDTYVDMATPDRPQLRVKPATDTLQALFLQSFDREHELLLELLRSGYATFVVGPQIVSACGNGRWRKVIDTTLFNAPNYSTSGRRGICC